MNAKVSIPPTKNDGEMRESGEYEEHKSGGSGRGETGTRGRGKRWDETAKSNSFSLIGLFETFTVLTELNNDAHNEY